MASLWIDDMGSSRIPGILAIVGVSRLSVIQLKKTMKIVNVSSSFALQHIFVKQKFFMVNNTFRMKIGFSSFPNITVAPGKHLRNNISWLNNSC